MAVNVARQSTWWDFPRSPAASRHLLETAAAHGVDAETCLAGTDMTAAALDDRFTEVRAEQELALMRNLLAHVDDATGLGAETGSRYNVAHMGILGYAMMTSASVRDAIVTGQRFLELSSAFVSIDLHETADALTLTLNESEIPVDVRDFVVERDTAAMVNVAPYLFTSSFDEHIRIRTGPNRLLSTQLCSIDVPFVMAAGSGATEIEIPASVLAMPMPAAEPHTAALCLQQCESLLDRKARRLGISASVRAILIEDPARMPSMVEIGRRLAVSERTLHRHLSAEGTTFRLLVNEVRETLASELLDSGFTVEQVARHLGYSETAAFTHAYTRWHGHPPTRRPKLRPES